MSKYIRLVLVLTLSAMLLVGCGSNTYKNIVKETTIKGEVYTIGQLVKMLTGKHGHAKWVVVKQKDNPPLVDVKVVITTASKPKPRVVRIHYALNPDTDQVKLIKRDIDGEELSNVAWALQISKIMIEN